MSQFARFKTWGLAAIAACAFGANAWAGPFDCSVAYDEFDSFMNKHYLMKPESYGAVATDRLTRQQFEARQKGRLLLRTGREGSGVAIVRTNKNRWGKFLFTWTGRGDSRGTPLLVLHDITLYNDVERGRGRRQFREIRMTASETVDLDSGKPSLTTDADVVYRNLDGKTLVIEATNGARLSFPLESLCAR
ncbi:MAG: hypothetical protein D6773_08715 [Alphaproteobacteria bacterium]|nr:MAG: hypothetical protein D6773_08715 [Alphaproteobacteria bacterium]